MVAVILGQTALAQSLPMETSQSIGIIDFVIKKSKYEETNCDAHSCQMKSVEGGVNLKLTHLSLIHICRCRRIERCSSRWSPYH